eukprot:UN34068
MNRARAIFRDIIRAIEYLHSQRIAHADLKPANVLLDKLGVAKVCDFGVSELLQGENETSYINISKTTPAYKAPEVIQKYLEKELRFRVWPADVWAAGVILFEMVCGVNPYHVPFDATDTENHILEFDPFDSTKKENVEKFGPYLGSLDISEDFIRKKIQEGKSTEAGKEEP